MVKAYDVISLVAALSRFLDGVQTDAGLFLQVAGLFLMDAVAARFLIVAGFFFTMTAVLVTGFSFVVLAAVVFVVVLMSSSSRFFCAAASKRTVVIGRLERSWGSGANTFGQWRSCVFSCLRGRELRMRLLLRSPSGNWLRRAAAAICQASRIAILPPTADTRGRGKP